MEYEYTKKDLASVRISEHPVNPETDEVLGEKVSGVLFPLDVWGVDSSDIRFCALELKATRIAAYKVLTYIRPRPGGFYMSEGIPVRDNAT